MRIRTLPLRALRAGFTLIELLAVILIISILAAALIPMVPTVLDRAEVTACSKNLQGIYTGITSYRIMYNRLPQKSGVKFFAEIYQMGAVEDSKANAERLICPGVNRGALTIGEMDWEEWWTDLEAIDGSFSSYAGRDCKNYPLRKLSGKQPLVCDDNDPEGNHRTTTNVLYGNGAVITFELKALQNDGTLTEDEEVLIVGPDSPVEDLQKFSLD